MGPMLGLMVGERLASHIKTTIKAVYPKVEVIPIDASTFGQMPFACDVAAFFECPEGRFPNRHTRLCNPKTNLERNIIVPDHLRNVGWCIAYREWSYGNFDEAIVRMYAKARLSYFERART